jgi:dTMP kinase
LIIYLKADPESLSKRAGYGEERFERVDFQKKVGEAFDKIF